MPPLQKIPRNFITKKPPFGEHNHAPFTLNPDGSLADPIYYITKDYDANLFFASPNGEVGKPLFRAIVPQDLGDDPTSEKILHGDGIWREVEAAAETVTSTARIAKRVNVVQQSKIEGSEQIFYRAHGTVQVGDSFFIGTREIPTDNNGTRIDEYYNLVNFSNPNNLGVWDAINFNFSGHTFKNCETACYDSVNNKIYMYATNNNTGDAVLISIEPSDIYDNSLVFNFGTNSVFPGPSPAICTDGTYVYGITYEYTPTMFKVRISDWTLVQSVELSALEDAYGHAAKVHVYPGKTELYFTTAFGGSFIKVDAANLATYTRIAVTTPDGVPILTDDLVYKNVDANGGLVYLGCENVNRGLVVNTTTMTYTVFDAVKSYGMFTNGTDLYSMGIEGYIEKFAAFNTASRETYTLSGFGSPNEFFYSSTGKFFCTTWPTDKYNSRLLEFTLPAAVNVNDIAVTGGMTIADNLTVGYNLVTKNLSTERIQFARPLNNTADTSYDANARGSIGFNGAYPRFLFNEDGYWRPIAQRFGANNEDVNAAGDNRSFDMAGGQFNFTNGTLNCNSATVLGAYLLHIRNVTAPSASIFDGYIQYAGDIVAGNSAPHFRTENGNIIKLFKGAALTAANNSALNTGDATSDTVIGNMRTRIAELEARLQAHGLLT